MPEGHALIVDDDPAVRAVLARLLEVWGLRVLTFAGGAEALARLPHGCYDLVFSDLGMAEISGWEVLAAVKAQAPDTVTFLVTGWGDQIDPREARRRGADYVIAKPFQADELRRLIQTALEQRPARAMALELKTS
jgi:CheY-like chemotaxis protein